MTKEIEKLEEDHRLHLEELKSGCEYLEDLQRRFEQAVVALGTLASEERSDYIQATLEGLIPDIEFFAKRRFKLEGDVKHLPYAIAELKKRLVDKQNAVDAIASEIAEARRMLSVGARKDDCRR